MKKTMKMEKKKQLISLAVSDFIKDFDTDDLNVGITHWDIITVELLLSPAEREAFDRHLK